MTELQKRLFALQDTGYRDFQMKLIPTVPADRAIGVRTPELRKLAKDLRKQEPDLAEAFSAICRTTISTKTSSTRS